MRPVISFVPALLWALLLCSAEGNWTEWHPTVTTLSTSSSTPATKHSSSATTTHSSTMTTTHSPSTTTTHSSSTTTTHSPSITATHSSTTTTTSSTKRSDSKLTNTSTPSLTKSQSTSVIALKSTSKSWVDTMRYSTWTDQGTRSIDLLTWSVTVKSVLSTPPATITTMYEPPSGIPTTDTGSNLQSKSLLWTTSGTNTLIPTPISVVGTSTECVSPCSICESKFNSSDPMAQTSCVDGSNIASSRSWPTGTVLVMSKTRSSSTMAVVVPTAPTVQSGHATPYKTAASSSDSSHPNATQGNNPILPFRGGASRYQSDLRPGAAFLLLYSIMKIYM